MRCETMRKRLSDLLDGAASPKDKARLEAHLRDCPTCRAYRADLARLQEQAGPAPERTPDYWAGFEKRLGSKLDSVEAGHPSANSPVFPRRKLAWAAVGFLVLAAAGTYLALIHRGPDAVETAWAAYEDPLVELLQEAESDPEFGNLVNREVLASIRLMTAGIESEAVVPAADDPFFWEGLSDPEIEFIAAELEKETGLGGPK
jgi:hypothetical protein